MSSLLRKFVVSARDRRLGLDLVALDQVAQHRPGADRGQLLRVADQDQPRLGPHRLEQPAHHGELDHRRLVDHDDVVLEPVRAVVPEPGAVVGPPAQQPVQRDPVGAPTRSATTRAVVGQLRHLGELADHRLVEPGRGLAGRRGQRDRQALAGRVGLVGEQAEDARDGGGLPGAGTAGEDRRPPAGGRDRRGLLLVAEVLAAHQRPRWPPAGRRRRSAAAARRAPQVVVDLLLEAVVAVEVEQVRGPSAAPRPRRAVRPERRRTHSAGSGHGSSGATSRMVPRSRQTEPRRTARTASASASRTRSSVSLPSVGDPVGDVHVGRVEQVARR